MYQSRVAAAPSGCSGELEGGPEFPHLFACGTGPAAKHWTRDDIGADRDQNVDWRVEDAVRRVERTVEEVLRLAPTHSRFRNATGGNARRRRRHDRNRRTWQACIWSLTYGRNDRALGTSWSAEPHHLAAWQLDGQFQLRRPTTGRSVRRSSMQRCRDERGGRRPYARRPEPTAVRAG